MAAEGTSMIIQPVNHVSLQRYSSGHRTHGIRFCGETAKADETHFGAKCYTENRGLIFAGRMNAIGFERNLRPVKRREKKKTLSILINLSLNGWPLGENVDFGKLHLRTCHIDAQPKWCALESRPQSSGQSVRFNTFPTLISTHCIQGIHG